MVFIFQFKKFFVDQPNCPQKFGTDALILGGYTPLSGVQRTLDVGSGSGILALMIAQRSESAIDAVEISESAFKDLKQNIQCSPWNRRISAYLTSLQKFKPTMMYDLIISNPPYFNNALQNPNTARANARHTSTLLFSDLVSFAKTHLTESGKLSVILPTISVSEFKKELDITSLYIERKLDVKSFSDTEVIRSVLIIGRKKHTLDKDSLVIYREKNVYSNDYIHLLKDFYLDF